MFINDRKEIVKRTVSGQIASASFLETFLSIHTSVSTCLFGTFTKKGEKPSPTVFRQRT